MGAGHNIVVIACAQQVQHLCIHVCYWSHITLLVSFRFHHIKSLTKRKHILEWGKELKLGGYSKPGYPGKSWCCCFRNLSHGSDCYTGAWHHNSGCCASYLKFEPQAPNAACNVGRAKICVCSRWICSDFLHVSISTMLSSINKEQTCNLAWATLMKASVTLNQKARFHLTCRCNCMWRLGRGRKWVCSSLTRATMEGMPACIY